MYLADDEIISTQVVLYPASGKTINENTRITSENINEFLPDKETYERAKNYFFKAGFDTGPLVGISFSVTAPVHTFTALFKVKFYKSEEGKITCEKENSTGSLELPVNNLPRDIQELIQSVTFTPPPDFGPSNFF
jgi:hypothetical protein